MQGEFFCKGNVAVLLSCPSGLRAEDQANIDFLATWIPGQARNDSKKTSPRNDKRKQEGMTDRKGGQNGK